MRMFVYSVHCVGEFAMQIYVPYIMLCDFSNNTLRETLTKTLSENYISFSSEEHCVTMMLSLDVKTNF